MKKVKKSALVSLMPLIKNSSRDNNIPEEVILSAMNKSYEALARKKYGMDCSFDSFFDKDHEDFLLYQYKKVVEEVKYPTREISLDDAKKHHSDATLGEELGFLVPDMDIKRNDVNFIKQILMNEIKRAERKKLLDEFSSRVGKVVSGIVKRVDQNGHAFIDLGRAEFPAVLYKNQQLPSDDIYVGAKVSAYLLSVNSKKDGPEIKLTRTSHLFFLKMLEQEFPEIQEGLIQVTKIAREAGERTKLVLKSNDSSVDVMRTMLKDNAYRLNQLRDELQGEKINVIEDTQNFDQLLMEVIKPGEITNYVVNEEYVDLIGPDDEAEIGKLIGKRGANLKLTASILGKKVNVVSKKKLKDKLEEASKELLQVAGLNDVDTQSLIQNNVLSISDLANSNLENLEKLFSVEKSKLILEKAKELVSLNKYEKAKEINIVESYSFPYNFVLPEKKDSSSSAQEAEKRLREELKSFKLK